MQLKDVKAMRIAAGMTQSGLALRAGVSQTLIARIESGSADPAYSKAMKIFSALEGARSNARISDVMTKTVVSIKSSETISKAARIMKSRGISQLPVLDDSKIVGTISEMGISHSFGKGRKLVREVMNMPLPMLDKNAQQGAVLSLLDFHSGVLITDSGRLCGIVTRADLLKLVRR